MVLENMQKSLEKTLADQNSKLEQLTYRMNDYENSAYVEASEYDDNGQYGPCDDYPDTNDQHDTCDHPDTTPNSGDGKRKADESDGNNNSRFKDMAKRFKATENVSENVNPILAETVNELFTNGLDEDHYTKMTKDIARPENCDGLTVVKMNQMIWDAVLPPARTADRKLQQIEETVIKSATIMVKVVNSLAGMEDQADKDIGNVIDNCNDAVALLGHANRQINMARKDFLRPELPKDYARLCNQSRPITKFLFGDDVSKSTKEIEDFSKISNKLQFHDRRPFRGGPIRRHMGRGLRFRGGYSRGARGRGYTHTEPGPSSYDPKNYSRRGSRAPFKK